MVRKGSSSALLVVLGLICVHASTASAQVSARPNIDPFRPTADVDGFLTLPGAMTPGHLLGGAGIFFDYTYQGLVTIDPAGAARRIDHRAAARLAGMLGLGRWASLQLDLPFILANRGPMVGTGDPANDVSRGGAGDPRISARARVAGARPEIIGELPVGAGLAFELGGTIPIGSSSAFASEGQLTLDLLAHVDYYFAPGAGLTVSLGWLVRPNDRVIFDETFTDAFLFGVGMRLPIPLVPKLTVKLEVRGSTTFSSVLTTPVEGEIGVSYGVGPVSLLAYFGTGFTDGAGAPLARAMVGVVYTRRTKDSDGDGIPDSVDKCPMLPEDFDGFEDEDGCEDPDNDGDFIMDDEDLCPFEAPPEGTDLDEDGCIDDEFR
jgi:OmpA-OmpF porin, OOP family